MYELYSSILATVEEEFTNATVAHLERIHEPGGYQREKRESDFMDMGMGRTYLEGLDDVAFTIEDSICFPKVGGRARGGAQIVTRWTAKGIHNRPFAEIAPSGEQVTIEGMTYTTFRDYNIRVEYTYWHVPELTRRMVER